MNKRLLGILAVILIGGAGFFILINEKEIIPAPFPVSPSLTPATSAQPDLGASGNSYRDQDNIFTLLYPDDYILDTQDPLHIRIYKREQTQRPQSEISDGVLMVFEPIKLQDSSLETWVDKRIQESITDGTSEIIEAKKSITQNGYPGFYYAIRSLGTSQNIILQKVTNSSYAVMITYTVNDPKQRGYQKEIDAVLASLTLLK